MPEESNGTKMRKKHNICRTIQTLYDVHIRIQSINNNIGNFHLISIAIEVVNHNLSVIIRTNKREKPDWSCL